MSLKTKLSELSGFASDMLSQVLKGNEQELDTVKFTAASWGVFVRALVGAGVAFHDLSEFGNDVEIMGWINGHLIPSERAQKRVMAYATERFKAG